MKLLDEVRQTLRVKYYSYRTEQCYNSADDPEVVSYYSINH